MITNNKAVINYLTDLSNNGRFVATIWDVPLHNSTVLGVRNVLTDQYFEVEIPDHILNKGVESFLDFIKNESYDLYELIK